MESVIGILAGFLIAAVLVAMIVKTIEGKKVKKADSSVPGITPDVPVVEDPNEPKPY